MYFELSEYTITYFSIFLLLDIGVASSLGLLNTAAINIVVQVFYGHKFSSFLGKYLGLEFLGYKVDRCMFIIIVRNHQFSKVVVHISYHSCLRVLAPHLCHQMLTVFLILAILVGKTM